MEDIFCKINSGRLPAYTIYKDEGIHAFLDIEPESEGHTLIAPIEHYKNIQEVPDEILCSMMSLGKKIAGVIATKYNFEGVQLMINSGEAIQDIAHLHLHIIGKRLAGGSFFYETFGTENELHSELKKIQLEIKKEMYL